MKQAFINLHFNSKPLSKSFYKRIFILLFCSILLFSTHTQAQLYKKPDSGNNDLANRSGISLQVGGNTFLGDLGGHSGNGQPFIKDWNFKTTKLFTGLSYTYFLDK